MRIALTVWNGRIAPVFDVAGTIRLVERSGSDAEEDRLISIPIGSGMISRVAILVEYRVDVLVCGAVSRPVHRMIADSGIKVHSFVAGDADEVLEALMTGSLEEKPFNMPGCGMGRGGRGCGRGAGNRGRGRNRGFGSGRKEV
ncbi:MAG: dinitrogenase iron-molybdenum cofactor biosynthesis protein [Candidatus Fermentibacteria bacterium]|nr:dinitrogenase iron-molybdenum cofactor biosynthesis protein [Candidatus Fermentibacteria bacterium]